MKKTSLLFALCSLLFISACGRNDPILPGERHAIFAGGQTILNTSAPVGELNWAPVYNATREFIQDENNIVWEMRGDANVRIFSGLPTATRVAGTRKVIQDQHNIYAGLSTGEVVAVNKNTREIVWVRDVFRARAVTGGAPILDIIAPMQLGGECLYVGGIGNAFCRIRRNDGHVFFCVYIGVALPFIITSTTAYVVATDGYLYAINKLNGDIFWRTAVRRQEAPELRGNTIHVGRERFNAITGDRN
ncbi:MAG: PQQ-like beta-propeller repeat protein [Alphaproteobacteria bacterium]|nr:PQQ-like beta-propeller repeat protein [Alphaproteobacteria bacterium]